MLSVIMLSVIILKVIMLSVIKLNLYTYDDMKSISCILEVI